MRRSGLGRARMGREQEVGISVQKGRIIILYTSAVSKSSRYAYSVKTPERSERTKQVSPCEKPSQRNVRDDLSTPSLQLFARCNCDR